MEDERPIITNLSKAKAIKPSNEIQNHKSKKAFKFNFVLISQNTNLWKTSFGKNSIPNLDIIPGNNLSVFVQVYTARLCKEGFTNYKFSVFLLALKLLPSIWHTSLKIEKR